jgi:hypothetical protein
LFTYVVTFRVSARPACGLTYDERHQSLFDAIMDSHGYWHDNQSFFLVKSRETTPVLVRRLSRNLSSQHDFLCVFDPSDMIACCFGHADDMPSLRSFFPSVIRVHEAAPNYPGPTLVSRKASV